MFIRKKLNFKLHIAKRVENFVYVETLVYIASRVEAAESEMESIDGVAESELI